MQLAPFVLYSLPHCPHCEQAEYFLRKKGLPHQVVPADDPIIKEGVKAFTKREEYPVLVYRLTKETIIGFDPEKYDRVTQHFYSLVRTSAPDLFVSPEQSQSQDTQYAQATQTA